MNLLTGSRDRLAGCAVTGGYRRWDLRFSATNHQYHHHHHHHHHHNQECLQAPTCAPSHSYTQTCECPEIPSPCNSISAGTQPHPRGIDSCCGAWLKISTPLQKSRDSQTWDITRGCTQLPSRLVYPLSSSGLAPGCSG